MPSTVKDPPEVAWTEDKADPTSQSLLWIAFANLLADFDAQDSSQPLLGASSSHTTVGREVFAAVTMVLPTAASLAVLLTGEGCLDCGWVMLFSFAAHMLASVAYHLANAMDACQMSIDARPWRCLDQSLIHAGFVACGWALCHSLVYAACVAAPVNFYAVVRLWHPSEGEQRHNRFVRMGLGLVTCLAPMVFRCDFWRLAGCLACGCCLVVFCVLDRSLLEGWGYGAMHLVCIPLGCLMMSSAMAVQESSFLPGIP